MKVYDRKTGDLVCDYESREVVAIDREGNCVKVYGTAREAARELGIDNSDLSKRCKSKSNKLLGGYIWRLITDVDIR